MRIITILLQKIFFRGLRPREKPAWREEAGSLGEPSFTRLARDGRELSVLKIETRQACRGVVILAPPLSPRGKFYFTKHGHAAIYLKLGFHIVSADFNGIGQSDHIDNYYHRDVSAVVRYARDCYPDESIVVHGLSFGAYHCVRGCLSLPAGSRVVVENCSRSLEDYWGRWFVTRALLALLNRLKMPYLREMDVRSSIAACAELGHAFLFIACENDKLTPLAEMRDVFDCASGEKRWIEIAGCAHLKAIDDPAYESMIRDWATAP